MLVDLKQDETISDLVPRDTSADWSSELAQPNRRQIRALLNDRCVGGSLRYAFAMSLRSKITAVSSVECILR